MEWGFYIWLKTVTCQLVKNDAGIFFGAHLLWWCLKFEEVLYESQEENVNTSGRKAEWDGHGNRQDALLQPCWQLV